MIELTGLNIENKVGHDIRWTFDDGTFAIPEAKFPMRVIRKFKPRFVLDNPAGTIIGSYDPHVTFKFPPWEIREDTLYIVSSLTAQMMKRWNFISPRSDAAGINRVDKVTTTSAFVMHAEVPKDVWRRICKRQTRK